VTRGQKIYKGLAVYTSTLEAQLFIYGEFYDQQILSTQALVSAHFDTGFSTYDFNFETLIFLPLIQ